MSSTADPTASVAAPGEAARDDVAASKVDAAVDSDARTAAAEDVSVKVGGADEEVRTACSRPGAGRAPGLPRGGDPKHQLPAAHS